MLGPWAWTLLVVAAVTGIFFTVMAFRGLIDSVEGLAERCCECGRATNLPLPLRRHACWRCRHPAVELRRHHTLPH